MCRFLITTLGLLSCLLCDVALAQCRIPAATSRSHGTATRAPILERKLADPRALRLQSVFGNTVYIADPFVLAYRGVGATPYGRTAYGSQFGYGPEAFVVDPTLFLDVADRYLQRSVDVSQRGFREFSEVARQFAGSAVPQSKPKTNPLVAPPPKEPPAVPIEPLLSTAALTIKNHCVRCHGGAAPKAGLNLADFGTPHLKYLDRILMRVSSRDPAIHMPPGKELPWDERQKLLCALCRLRHLPARRESP